MKYIKPEVSVIEFKTENVIMASGVTGLGKDDNLNLGDGSTIVIPKPNL